MNKPIYFPVFAAFCLAMLSIPSGSLAFRCGEEVVARGASTAEVLYKCGEPEYITGKKKEIIASRRIPAPPPAGFRLLSLCRGLF